MCSAGGDSRPWPAILREGRRDVFTRTADASFRSVAPHPVSLAEHPHLTILGIHIDLEILERLVEFVALKPAEAR